MTKTTVETINLYQRWSWKFLFAAIRFWDSPYIRVEKLVPSKGKIIDLGCGEGFFANFLALSSKKRKIIGIDVDERRVSQASRGLDNTEFRHADATRIKIPKANCFVLFHLLHHLGSFEKQKELLSKIKKSLLPSGKLIIVEIDKKPKLKFSITWLTDHFIVPLLFEKRAFEKNVFYREKRDWEKILHQEGFKTKSLIAHQGKPFSHVVFVAKKV